MPPYHLREGVVSPPGGEWGVGGEGVHGAAYARHGYQGGVLGGAGLLPQG